MEAGKEGGITKRRLMKVMVMFTVLIVAMISLVFTPINTCQIGLCNMVRFTVCQLHLNKTVKKASSWALSLPKYITRYKIFS